jgi:site-specific recombinase XerD
MPAPNPLLSRPLSDANEATLRAFTRSLRAAGKSDRTVQSYDEAARLLVGFLGLDLDAITRQDVERFLIDQLETRSATSAAVRFRSLQQVFGWMVREDYIAASPMDGLKAPKPTTKPVPVIPDDGLKALVRACQGRDTLDRRDEAILRLLIDTGVRVSELTGLQVEDVDMRQDVITVHGKGDKVRILPFGARTGAALERYLRLRARHTMASSPMLWVGSRGKPLTPSGVTQMLERRSSQAGIARVHPHQFRHSAASFAMDNGVGDDAVMRLMGWTSRDMLNRYGSAVADERARKAHRALAPGDRI